MKGVGTTTPLAPIPRTLETQTPSGEDPAKIGNAIAAQEDRRWQHKRKRTSQTDRLEMCTTMLKENIGKTQDKDQQQEALKQLQTLEGIRNDPPSKTRLKTIYRCEDKLTEWKWIEPEEEHPQTAGTKPAPNPIQEPTTKTPQKVKMSTPQPPAMDPAPEQAEIVPPAVNRIITRPLIETAPVEPTEPTEPTAAAKVTEPATQPTNQPTTATEPEGNKIPTQKITETPEIPETKESLILQIIEQAKIIEAMLQFCKSQGILIQAASDYEYLRKQTARCIQLPAGPKQIQELQVLRRQVHACEAEIIREREEQILLNTAKPQGLWFRFKMKLLILILLPEKEWKKAANHLRKEASSGLYPPTGAQMLKTAAEHLDKKTEGPPKAETQDTQGF